MVSQESVRDGCKYLLSPSTFRFFCYERYRVREGICNNRKIRKADFLLESARPGRSWYHIHGHLPGLFSCLFPVPLPGTGDPGHQRGYVPDNRFLISDLLQDVVKQVRIRTTPQSLRSILIFGITSNVGKNFFYSYQLKTDPPSGVI
jgi:hypothetical protein